jgi:hypothetical protein
MSKHIVETLQRMMDERISLEEALMKPNKGKLPTGVVVKKVTDYHTDGASEHEVHHNGKELGTITDTWDEGHVALHEPKKEGGSQKHTSHPTRHAAVKAILKTHGID